AVTCPPPWRCCARRRSRTMRWPWPGWRICCTRRSSTRKRWRSTRRPRTKAKRQANTALAAHTRTAPVCRAMPRWRSSGTAKRKRRITHRHLMHWRAPTGPAASGWPRTSSRPTRWMPAYASCRQRQGTPNDPESGVDGARFPTIGNHPGRGTRVPGRQRGRGRCPARRNALCDPLRRMSRKQWHTGDAGGTELSPHGGPDAPGHAADGGDTQRQGRHAGLFRRAARARDSRRDCLHEDAQLMRSLLSRLSLVLGLCAGAAAVNAQSPAPPAKPAPGTWRVLDSFEVGEGVYVRALTVEAARNAMWVGTSAGVHEVDMKTLKPRNTFTRNDGLANEYVFSVGVDKQGNKWFGTNAGGVSRYNDGKWKTFFPMHGLADYWVYCFASQKDGTLWIGTWAGTSKVDPQSGKFTTYVRELINEWVYGLGVDSQD